MDSASELLDVIESSHLELAERMVERRGYVIQQISEIMERCSANTKIIAGELAGLLVDEGVILADKEDIENVIAEYFDVVVGEEESLGDEEKDFLESFLK